jgi:2'-hydroxyisoflavone reductase
MHRRDFITSSALAALAMAMPAVADAAPQKPLRLLILGGTGFIGPH